MTYNKLYRVCESSQKDYDYELFIGAILFIQEETYKIRSRYNYELIEETLYHFQYILPNIQEEYQEYLDDSISNTEIRFYKQELSKINNMIIEVNNLINKVIEF
jgi:hypothetical protein